MGTCASRTVGAPVSHQKARISFDLHGCVTWMSMPRTALEPLDRSSQPARSVVLNDPRLQLDRVEHRSLAGCSMHNLGSGQRVAARARWRGRASRRTSANGVCCSGGATMRGRVGGVECRSVGFALTPLTLLDAVRGGPTSRWLDTGLTLVSECRTECRLTLVSGCRGVGIVSG